LIDRLKTKPINNFNTTADRIICHNKEPAAKGGGGLKGGPWRSEREGETQTDWYTHKHSMRCHNPLFALTAILINEITQGKLARNRNRPQWCWPKPNTN